MKWILKFLALPVIAILCVLTVVLNLAMRVYCIGAGIAFMCLALFLLLALVFSQWQNLAILGAITGVGVLVTLGIGFLVTMVEIMRDGLIGFVKV